MEDLKLVFALLQDSKALKRESGAKKARKLGLTEAGNAVLQALHEEVKDKRTWSAQYQFIITLGVIKVYQALPFLWDLTKINFEATILYQALGNAIIRLSFEKQGIKLALEDIFATQDVRIFNGAFRAMAMLKLVPDELTIKKIIKLARNPDAVNYLRSYPSDRTGLRYWVAVSCAGWESDLVTEFLEECILMGDTTLRLAAETSKKGKYIKYEY